MSQSATWPVGGGSGGSTGTVTSVGLTAPGIFSVSGSPVTTSGTLALTLATQSANLVWAGPTTGAAAAPTFRSIVSADLGSLTYLDLNGAPTTGILNIKAQGAGLTDGFNLVSSGGASTISFVMRDSGQFFIWDGGAIPFQSMGAFAGSGPSAPAFGWDVNKANASTTITSQGSTGIVAARNTDSTANNFSEFAFVNSNVSIDAAMVGIHEVNSASYSGSVAILTSTGGTLAESVRITTTGQLKVQQAGVGLSIKEGSNCKQGVSTLSAGSVVVSTTAVTANSRIQLTGNADGGTPGWVRVSARTAATSFTITSSSGTDTSSVAWFITEPS